jgi:F-type H+-transporting ATPase subunit epsilon
VTLHVELVVPEGEVWAGDAERVIAKTLDGDIGVLTGHTPVLGILAEGSVVRILPEGEGAADGELAVAVHGGFLSIADNRVSILAHQAQLGSEVDSSAVRAVLDSADEAGAQAPGGDGESAEVRYFRAQLRAAGDRA